MRAIAGMARPYNAPPAGLEHCVTERSTQSLLANGVPGCNEAGRVREQELGVPLAPTKSKKPAHRERCAGCAVDKSAIRE
jgi:hypothetical protein